MLKIGVIGYGYWGPNLVRNFAETPNVQVTMVADSKPNQLARLKSRYPAIETVSDAKDLIQSANVDAVVIATPVNTHFSLAIMALQAGKQPGSFTCACNPGFFGNGTSCRRPLSCSELLALDPTAPTGQHVIDPDGDAPGAEFEVHCDMERDGGGWTLAMRFAPSGSVFTFFAPHWDTPVTLAETGSLDPAAPSDAKFTTFNLVTGREIRGCLTHPVTAVQGCKRYDIGGPRTLLDLFANTPVGSDVAGRGRFFQESREDMLVWLSIQGRSLADASSAANYVATGINIDDDQSCYDARVRFGMGLNNETHIGTLNDTAGFGASSFDTSTCENQQSAFQVGAGFAAGSRLFQTAGTIWIR